MKGCSACHRTIDMCKRGKIRYRSYPASDHQKKIQKVAPGYDYVPVIVDARGKFIGGSVELEKILKKAKVI